MRAAHLAALLGVALAAPAHGQQADPCASFKWSVAREKQAFTGAQLPILKSGAQYPGILSGVTVALGPQDKVDYPQPPIHKPNGTPSNGAFIAVAPLAVGGTYQVTLSDEAWVDLVQDGKIIRSSTFSGAQGCPGIRKSVKFKLAQGPLTIEISDARSERVNLDLLPVEAE